MDEERDISADYGAKYERSLPMRHYDHRFLPKLALRTAQKAEFPILSVIYTGRELLMTWYRVTYHGGNDGSNHAIRAGNASAPFYLDELTERRPMMDTLPVHINHLFHIFTSSSTMIDWS